MADLSDIQAAQTVKIVGSGTSGLEQTPVQSTSSGAIHSNLRDNSGTEFGTTSNPIVTSVIANTAGVNGAISVTTTPIAAKVGASNLSNRKVLSIFNLGTAIIYWGLSNTVSSSNGTLLMRNQQLIVDFGPNITVWLVAASGTHDVRICEVS